MQCAREHTRLSLRLVAGPCGNTADMWIRLAFVLTLAIAAAACGSDDGDNTTAADADGQWQASWTADSAKTTGDNIELSGVDTEVVLVDPDGLIMRVHHDQWLSHWDSNGFAADAPSALISYDATSEQVEEGAASVELTRADRTATTATFSLREGEAAKLPANTDRTTIAVDGGDYCLYDERFNAFADTENNTLVSSGTTDCETAERVIRAATPGVRATASDYERLGPDDDAFEGNGQATFDGDEWSCSWNVEAAGVSTYGTLTCWEGDVEVSDVDTNAFVTFSSVF